MDLKIHDATLATLCDGELEQQFQGALRSAASIFAALDDWEQTGDGHVVVEIPIRITLAYSVKTHTIGTSCRPRPSPRNAPPWRDPSITKITDGWSSRHKSRCRSSGRTCDR